MKNYLLLALAAVALCFTACKKDNPEPTPVAVTGISLDKTMVALEIDESATVKAIIAPENATNKAVEWSVADTAVATVSNGVVTGVAVGETTLTATTADGGFTATIPVKVVTEKVAVTGISFAGFLSGGNPTLKEGKFSYTFVMFTPENATNKNLTFTCDKPELVSIQEDASSLDNGFMTYTITAIKAGEVEFTAVSEDGGFTLTKTMTILPIVKVTEIDVTPKDAKIEVGATKQFAAAISPSDADNKAIEWSSSDTSVATIDANGLVTGVAKGEATITATAKDGSGVKGSATITVIVPPTSVTFDGKTDQEIYTWWGKEVDLKAKVTPEGASLKTLTWLWNDPNASSNPDGLKYNVTDDKATLTYTWPSQTSKLRGVNVRAFYGDGNTVYAEADVYFQTFAWLLRYSGNAINYEGLYPFGEDFDYKCNWDNKESNKLAFIAYYRSSGNENARPQYYKEYYIPTSEYTLTSSDPSKVKVTKSADGESWEIERLNTTDLAAVTLTYKCGEHTQTYTINLIP
ncbi:MAG: Ig-like domain-containing protein [Alistipes sp.]|nr:Ig-like domain-containing protein [Alistipes sp.]